MPAFLTFAVFPAAAFAIIPIDGVPVPDVFRSEISISFPVSFVPCPFSTYIPIAFLILPVKLIFPLFLNIEFPVTNAPTLFTPSLISIVLVLFSFIPPSTYRASKLLPEFIVKSVSWLTSLLLVPFV